uniref:AAA+ ATPase domain-containing protein n=2 Tax=Amphimedon queenslandica TaxID=400682 RepID=A0A1X7TIU7_AMPQE
MLQERLLFLLLVTLCNHDKWDKRGNRSHSSYPEVIPPDSADKMNGDKALFSFFFATTTTATPTNNNNNCQILIETLSLPPVLSPSLYAHCSIVHCNSLLTCQDLTVTWLQNGSVKHDLSVSGMDTLSFLMDTILPQMLEFTASHGNTLTGHIQKQTDLTLHLIQSFLSLLSAVLDRHSPKKEDSIPYSTSRASSNFNTGGNLSKMDSVSSMVSVASSVPQRSRIQSLTDQPFPEMPTQSSVLSFTGVDESVLILDEIDKLSTESDCEIITVQYLMTTAFVFSLIWSFGGYIDSRHYNEFSKAVRDVVSSLPMANDIIPQDGLVFDYFLDQKTQQFLPWSERKRDSGASKSNTPIDSYVPIPELERFVYISELYLGYGFHVLFIGEEGSGKTSFLKKFIQPRMSATLVPISSSLTPLSLQSTLLSRIAQLRKRQTNSKKTSNQRRTFILDDLHLASLFPYLPGKDEDEGNWCDSFSSYTHPPLINLVSHLAEHKTLHDEERDYTHSLPSLRLVGTCTTDGVQDLSLSLLRWMRPVPFISVSNEGLHLILQQRIMTLVKKLPVESMEKATLLVNALATASLAIHDNMKKRFNSVSSPAHPHIHFFLRHTSELVNGLLLMEPTTDKSAISLMNKLRRRGGIHLTGMELVSIPGVRRGNKKSSKSSGSSGGGVRSSRSSSRLTTSRGQQPKSLPPLTESLESTGGDSESQSKLGGVTRQQTHPGARMSGKLSGKGSALQNKSSSVSVKDQEESEGDKMTRILRVLFRVWCHECSRVFTDHLTQSKDKIWFSKLLESVLKYCFCGAVLGETGGEGGERGGGGGGGGRRARPGRPSKVSQAPSSISLATSVIQASDLKNIGIDFTILQELLPKESQHQFLTFDQIAMRGEDLSSFIFCRLSQRELSLEKTDAKDLGNYNEVGDGEIRILLADTLSNSERELSHIFINKDIIEHVTRLSRALVLPGGHILYLGPCGVGRKTTVKLSAAIVNAKVYNINQWNQAEEKEEDEGNLDTNEKKTKEIFGLPIVREACKTAALDHKRVVLLVDGSLLPWYHELWDILLEIMRTGLSPSLFTSSELILMSFKVQQGKVLNVRRTAETAYQSFAQAVFPLLHIVITWDTPGINNTNNEIFRPISCYSEFYDEGDFSLKDFYIGEEQRRSLFNTLTKTTSYMDHYLPWSKNSFSEVALQFWQSPAIADGSVFPSNTSKLEALSFLAAHVHLSSCAMLQRVSPRFTGWLFTVRDYKHCLEMGYRLALDWKLEKEKSISQYHTALSKLYDLERQLSSLKWKLDEELNPKLLQAKDDVQLHMEKITAAKQHYMAADKRCKDAEETIKRETEQMRIFKEQLDDKFNEVSPLHYSALKTLSSVERGVVMEIMGYRIPPGPLMPVFEALCLLFDRPATWLDCQQLMLSQHFFESLKFFDKDGVPKSKLRKLEKLLVDQEKMSIEVLADASQAIVPLVLWITALVDYRKTRSILEPFKEKLQRAENTLTEAQEVYVDMRQEMLNTKAALEATVESHKVALKKANAIEGEVKLVEEKIASTKELFGSLSNQRKKWENKLSVVQNQLDSLSSHSLLVSASCTYLGFLPPEEHKSLWENWISYCSGHVSIGSLVVEERITHEVDIKLQEGFSFHSALATDDEKLVWEREEIFPDLLSLEKCLQWKAVSRYSKGYYHQVMFDPLSFFSKYMNGLIAIKNRDNNSTVNLPYTSTDSTDSKLTDKLIDAAREGKSIAVHIQSLSITDSFNNVLNQILSWSESTTSSITLNGKELHPQPHFQVFFVFSVSPYSSPLHSVVGKLLQTTPTILLSSLLLSQEGLSSLFESHILQCMRRELCIQRRASMADISLHQKQVNESQEIVLSQVLELDWSEESNKFASTIESFIKESEDQEQSALSHIKESRQSLEDIAHRTTPYKSLSSHAALSFITCQRLSQKLPQVNIRLKDFLDMLQSLCEEREGTRFHSSHTSLAAYLSHLESSLTTLIHERLSPHLFAHQLNYFPLLLAILKEASASSSSSGRLLTSYILNPMSFSIRNLLDDIMFTSETRPDSKKKLASEGVINIAHSLEAVEGLEGLVSSIQTDEEQWSDYFKSFSSLLLPTPFSSHNLLSPTHKLLLWKALEPNQFDAAIKDYICLTLGPQFEKPHSFSVPSNHVGIILVFNKDVSFNELISVSNERGLPIVRFSALKFVDIDRLRELLVQPVWVVINHLYHCKDWMDTMERINQCLESSQGSFHTSFKCFIPLSLLQLLALKHHSGLSSYHVIALTGNDLASSFTTSLRERLLDYYNVFSHTKREPQSLSIDELKPILNKIHSLLPPIKSNLIYDSQEDDTNTILETILNKAHSSLQSLQSYVEGHQLYTAQIGFTLSVLMDNNVPTDWYYPHQHINKGKTLVEFIQLVRHLYYY